MMGCLIENQKRAYLDIEDTKENLTTEDKTFMAESWA
jgi:hypothetical protein